MSRNGDEVGSHTIEVYPFVRSALRAVQEDTRSSGMRHLNDVLDWVADP